MAHAGGRPRKYTDKEVQILVEKFSKYIQDSQIPIIAEFAYMNNIVRQTLYDYPEFSTLIKICMQKKEAQLEKAGLSGAVNVTMAIFSLKQLGWRDKPKDEAPADMTALYQLIASKINGH